MEKSVLITGASRGIGKALCIEALARGYKVHALVRQSGSAPKGCVEHLADIRDREKVKALVTSLGPALQVFIANAGIEARFSSRDPDYAEKAAEVFDVNVTATGYSLYRMASEWIRTGVSGRRLVVVSSLAAGRAVPGSGAYVASKTAELIMAQGLERDLERFGIGVSVVQPGFIDTEMSAALPHRPFLISSEKAARITWNGIERSRFRIAYPRVTSLVMSLANAVPFCLYRAVVRVAQRLRLV